MQRFEVVPGMEIPKRELTQISSEFLLCVNDVTAIDKAVRTRFESINTEAHLVDIHWMAQRLIVGLQGVLDVHFGRSPKESLPPVLDFLFFARFYALAFRRAHASLRRELDGKLRDGLRPKRDLREFFAELLVAFAYESCGQQVTIIDPNETAGRRFDCFVQGDAGDLEVEVKTISSLSGLPVDRRVLTSALESVASKLRDISPPSEYRFFDVCLIGRRLILNDILRAAEKCIRKMQMHQGRTVGAHDCIQITSTKVRAEQFEEWVQVLRNPHIGTGQTLYEAIPSTRFTTTCRATF